MNFLARVEGYDVQEGESSSVGAHNEPAFELPRLVSFWPLALDEMAMNAYAQDANLVESRAADFHPDVQRGLDLVRLRFGRISRDALPAGTVESLARMHVQGRLPWYGWVVEDGELQKIEIGRRDGDGPAFKQQFLVTFSDEVTWAKAVLDAIFLEDHCPPFGATLEAWPIASLEQLQKMISTMSIDNHDRVIAYDLVLGRDDSSSELLEMARNLAAESQWKQAEFVAVAAILTASRAGQIPPAEALELVSFRSLDTPYEGSEYPSLPCVIEALQACDEDQVVARFKQVFDGEQTRLEAFLALKSYPGNEALLARALEMAAVIATGPEAGFSVMSKVACGLVMLGADALPFLADAFDAAETPLLRDTYRRAILGILAEADEAQAPTYDRFVSLVDFEDRAKTRESELGYYLAPDYIAALEKLARGRARTRVGEDIDEAKPMWHRALAALRVVPYSELFDKAFGLIAKNGLPPNEGFDWFEPVLWELREEIAPFIGPALAASRSPDFHNAVQSSFGEDAYQKILDAAGALPAVDTGPLDKIRRLSEAVFETRPDLERTVIYVFERRDDETPAQGTINRIGGRPFGVSAETWPMKAGDKGSPMHHILTLDLDTLPLMRGRYEDTVRGLALFVRNPHYNEAWVPHSSDAEVRPVLRNQATLFEEDLPVGEENATAFAIHEVEMPLAVWTVEYDTDPALERIRDTLYGCSAWCGGGGPIWLQDAEHSGCFVLQFDESFAHMNLGDCGIMYVFDDTAFWQCH